VLVIRTPDERLIWLQALGSRRKEDVTVVVADDFDVTGEPVDCGERR
jgi:hypothetical protein